MGPPRQAVGRLEVSGFNHDNDNHSYHVPVGFQGLLASSTHEEEVRLVVRSLGSGAGVENQKQSFSTMGPYASYLVFSSAEWDNNTAYFIRLLLRTEYVNLHKTLRK